MATLVELTERVKKPGIESVLGVRRENKAAAELKQYFKALAKRIGALELGQLVDSGANKARVLGLAATKIDAVLTRLRPILYAVIATNQQLAYLEGWHQFVGLKEADQELDDLLRQAAKAARVALQARRAGSVQGSALDQLGASGKAAAKFAAERAAATVAGIDQTTRDNLAKIISQAIDEQLGADKLARMLQAELDDEAVYRSRVIASTEMNQAFSQASLDKMKSLDFAYKELIPSEDACPICLDIADEGPIPVDSTFSDGSQRPPIHPGCRCAVVAARDPEGENQ